LHQEESAHYQKKTKNFISPSSQKEKDENQLSSILSDLEKQQQEQEDDGDGGIDLSGYMVEGQQEPKKEKGIDIK